MFIQGNLQRVFDALYQMGLIEPVLEMNWSDALNEIKEDPVPLTRVVTAVNTHSGTAEDLADALTCFDEKELSFLAMEVAREFADFHSRNQVH